MGSQISWGLPITKVIRTFANSVDSWITMAIGTLMVEVVDVGGGTVGSFSQMADFTRKVNELESDKRSALRPYVFVVYMAGIMLVLTTFMMVYFLSAPLAAGITTPIPGLAVAPETVQQLLTASIFDGWVIGLVAGKMGGGTVADGFKHSLILVIVGALMVSLSGVILGHQL
jgi:flagellar protein FlaJ